MRYKKIKNLRRNYSFSFTLLNIFAIYLLSFYSLSLFLAETNAVLTTKDSNNLSFSTTSDWEDQEVNKAGHVLLEFIEDVKWECEPAVISAKLINTGERMSDNEPWQFQIYHIVKGKDASDKKILIETEDTPVLAKNELGEISYDLTKYFDENQANIDFDDDDALTFKFKLIRSNDHPDGKKGSWSDDIVMNGECEKAVDEEAVPSELKEDAPADKEDQETKADKANDEAMEKEGSETKESDEEVKEETENNDDEDHMEPFDKKTAENNEASKEEEDSE